LYFLSVCNLSKYFQLQEQQNGGEGYTWDKEVIDKQRAQPNICGQYNLPQCDFMIKKHQNLIYNQTGIIVGTQIPWAEAALLNAGAKHIMTIEYMKIKTDYPRLSAMHPSEAARAYLDKKWESVDFAWSFSSLEHDGLGRYGDPLNPFGDLESIGRIRCLLKPGGILMVGFPSAQDALVWNAHRLYGKYRLALVFAGWRILDSTTADCDVGPVAKRSQDCQPIIVLQKPWAKH
jgi:hypothetical protein